MKYNRICLIILMIFSCIICKTGYTQYEFWYDLSPGVYAGGLVLGDIDRNGSLDLIMTGSNASGNHFKVYKNNGSGIFTEFQDISPGVYYNFNVTLGDIDNDGDLDLMTTGAGGGYHFKTYKNNGSGIFSLNQDLSPGVIGGATAVGDIDTDGDLDLFMMGRSGGSCYLQSLYNDGSGTFLPSMSMDPGIYLGSLTLGDFDSDRDYDLIILGADIGNQRCTILYTNNSMGFFSNYNNLSEQFNTGSIAVGDIDSDRDLDLLVIGMGNASSLSFKVITNDGQGNLSEAQSLSPGVSWGSIALGDTDNDGDLDVVMSGDSVGPNVFKVFTNDSTGYYAEFQDITPGVSSSCIVLGDIDSDGDLDMVMSGDNSGTKYLRVYRNTNMIANSRPGVCQNMRSIVNNGYWQFLWDAPSDDHTSANMLRYKIAMGTKQSEEYNYISDVINYPQGQANIGNIPQGAINSTLFYQSKIPVTKTVYWKVCSFDSALKRSYYCSEQVASGLYTKINKLEPSEGEFFKYSGTVYGETGPTYMLDDDLGSIEIRIRNIENNMCWNNNEWVTSSNIWIVITKSESWEYNCKEIPWDFGVEHIIQSRPVSSLGEKGNVCEGKKFIPVYYLPENSFISYPNPFDPNNETTTIEYLLTQDEKINLIIYDLSGQIVYDWTFFPGNEGAKQGLNRIIWDGKNKQNHTVANGIYFTYLKKGDNNKLTKIMVIK